MDADAWRYVSLNSYQPVEKSFDDSIETGFNFLKRLVASAPDDRSPFQPTDQLVGFSKTRLNRLVPNPDWHQLLGALSNLLEEKLEKNEQGIQILLSIPGSEHDQVVVKWLNSKKLTILEPPSFETILEQGDEWLQTSFASDQPVQAIVNFERFFINHHRGLQFIRKLIARINSTAGMWIIEMNSWFWAFMQSRGLFLKQPNVSINQTSTPTQLKTWIQALTIRSKRFKFLFRKTNDGKYLIYPNEAGEHEDKNIVENTDEKFFRKMNAYCLGQPSIALDFWKNNLRAKPDEEFLKHEEDDENETSTSSQFSTIWVLPWEKIPKPKLATKLSYEEEGILWNIILHGKLSSTEVEFILGPTFGNISTVIQRLVDQEVLQLQDSRLMMNPPFYPAVAKLLKGEGYLTDGLVI